MEEDTGTNGDSVRVNMEIEGDFDSVMEKIEPNGDSSSNIDIVRDDLFIILDAVVETEGGTRSAIAERISGQTAIEYDSEAIVDVFRVLARYELVVLEGNTWKPGPKAHTS